MSPRFTTSDPADRSACGAVLGGEHFAVIFAAEDFAHLGGGQFHVARTLSLLSHVTRIIGMRAKKKVGWINTGGDITFMAYAHPLRDRSVTILEAGPVRVDVSVSDMGNAITADRSVLRAEPYPAPVRATIYLRPKTFCEHDANADADCGHSQAIMETT